MRAKRLHFSKTHLSLFAWIVSVSRNDSNLRKHGVDVTQQENDSEDTRDSNSKPVPSIVRTHPKHDPAQHDQEDTRKVQLDHVVSQTSLQQEGGFDNGIIT